MRQTRFIQHERRASLSGADAKQYLVGGVNSPVRAFRQVGAEPLIVTQGQGAEVVSASGTRFVDYIMGWGALILGHRHPKVVTALERGLRRGTVIGLTHPAEIELARLITEAVPSVEQVRFTASGTEACMTAIRLARAVTGRSKLLVFEGCYHGHSDSPMAGHTAGLPKTVEQETIRAPFNDPEAFERIIRQQGGTLAAVILEPVAANMGVVPPEPGQLERIRALTSREGIQLIFDEVVTGFRVGRGGAQRLFNITPDLTTFGKIIGGGMPIGAVGGSRRLMARLAPDGDVYHGGTFAGHPLSMAAGVATLKALRAHPPYERLERLSARLADEMARIASRVGVPLRINRVGSMFTVFFSPGPVRDFTQANATRQDRFARWANGLRHRGILVAPSPFEAVFLSTAHTARHVGRFLDAAADTLAAVRNATQ